MKQADIDEGNWHVVPVNISSLNALHFLDPEAGWAAGNGIFGTTDGGATWTQPATIGSIYDLYAVDEDHGRAAGNGGIVYRTTDGWATWTSAFAGVGGTTATDVLFLDHDHGWAAGIGGHLSETVRRRSCHRPGYQDHHEFGQPGVTWTTRYTGGYMTAVHFFDHLEGWGLGGNTFVHTTDGGATGSTVATPAGTWVHSGTFLDRQHGIAVGDGGNIVYTHDGRQTWQTARGSTAGPRLWEVDCSHGGVAVTAGENGVLLRSDDLGITWTRIQSGASRTAQGLAALDADKAWAAHRGGEIELTTDGGELWERVQVNGLDVFGEPYAIGFAKDAQNGWAAGYRTSSGRRSTTAGSRARPMAGTPGRCSSASTASSSSASRSSMRTPRSPTAAPRWLAAPTCAPTTVARLGPAPGTRTWSGPSATRTSWTTHRPAGWSVTTCGTRPTAAAPGRCSTTAASASPASASPTPRTAEPADS